MQSNYLKCTFCLQDFNSTTKTPYILIECGHSICQKCLNANIKKQVPFTCPEDQCEINTFNRNLSHFPKNQALLNMVGLQIETNSQDDSHDESMEEENEPDLLGLSKEEEENSSVWNSHREKKSKRRATLKTVPKRLETHGSGSYSDDGAEEICVKHHKRLEVICTEPGCQVKVCYQCGLFGEHSVG